MAHIKATAELPDIDKISHQIERGWFDPYFEKVISNNAKVVVYGNSGEVLTYEWVEDDG